MPYKSQFPNKKKYHKNYSEETNIQDDNNNKNATKIKRIVYWLDYRDESHEEDDTNDNIVLSFHRHDIMTSKVTPKHLKSLLKRKYGERTTRVNDEELLRIVQENHNEYKDKFRNEFKSSFESIMVDIALELGMRDGKAKYAYIDIVKHVLVNPSYSTICRLSYLMRGVFDCCPNWKIKLETQFMKIMGYVYTDGFKSQGKDFGCFSQLISEVFTQKHRDINARLLKKLKFKCVQRSLQHKNLNRNQLPIDNKSFFGIMKNVQFVNEDDAAKINLTIPDNVKNSNNSSGEIHYSLLEGIIFPHGAIGKANVIVGRWVGDLDSNISYKPSTNVSTNKDFDKNCLSQNNITQTNKKKKKQKRKKISTNKNNRNKISKRQTQLFDTDSEVTVIKEPNTKNLKN